MAGSSVIGALRVTLGLDSAQFTSGAKTAEGRAEQLGLKIGRSLRSATGEVTSFAKAFTALGTIAGGAALGALAARSLEYASSLGEVAQQLGVSSTALQEYRYAATQVGISQEEIDKGLAKLTVTMGQAREGVAKPKAAFKELSDLLGKDVLKSAQTAGDAIPLIADALSKISDPAKRAAIEVALFGKTGQRLDTLLAGGSAGVNELTQAAHDLGIVLSGEQIANADKAADKISELKTVLEANIAGAVADNTTALYDFASAIERMIGLIPAAINGLGKFRDYLNIGGGVLNAAGGLITGNQGRIGQGIADAASARNDLTIRQNYGKPFFGDKQRLSVSKYIATLHPASAGAGTSAADATSAASKAAAAAAKAQREREAADKKAAADERRYQQELGRSRDDYLSAQQDLTVNQTDRVAIEHQLLASEHATRLESIATDEHLTDAQKRQLTVLENDTNMLKARLINRRDEEALAHEALDLAQARADNDAEVLNAQKELARTAKERGRIEMLILDSQFDQLKATQQAVLDSQASSDSDKQIARERLTTLGTLQGAARIKSAQDNAGPLQQYLSGIPKGVDEMNEALQKISTDGLGSLIDGLSNVEGGFKGLADTVSSVASQIISSLLRIGLQKGIAALFGAIFPNAAGGISSSLLDAGSAGTAGSVAALGGSGLPSLAGYRAAGGPVIGGKSYVVGERGQEIFTPSVSGKIIANDDIGMGGGRFIIEPSPWFDVRAADAAQPGIQSMGARAAAGGAQIANTNARKAARRRLGR